MVSGAEHNRRARLTFFRAMRDDLREAERTHGATSADYLAFRQGVLSAVSGDIQFLLDLATSHLGALGRDQQPKTSQIG